MLLIRVCLPLVLSSSLWCAAVSGQQAQTAAPKKPAQTTAAKRSGAQNAATHRAVHRKRATAKLRKGAKRPEYRPEYSETSVEVINGDATRKVVFQDEQAASAAKAKKLPASLRNAPQPMKVEVVNGAAVDTQYFYDNGQEQLAARNQPVVIGIQSSDTRIVGGNKNPVVTGVTSSSANDARTAGASGQPVTERVSPKPKRQVYQPEQ